MKRRKELERQQKQRDKEAARQRRRDEKNKKAEDGSPEQTPVAETESATTQLPSE